MSKDNMPLVSVVTPVYNGQAFIAQCIESVIAQSYQNWELIILNNNSSDDSLALAKGYAEQDDRIRIESNAQTLPQMENWNRSMSLISSKSQYCKVVHADDWLFPNCLTEMVALAQQNPSVAIVGSFRLEEESVTLDGLPYPSACVKGNDVIRRRFLGGADLFGSPTSIMYRSDQVHSREKFYNEANLHADTEICYEILKNHDFGFVHQVLTFTRRHNETTSTFARRMQTYMPSDLLMLKEFGPAVLDSAELTAALSQKMKNYYRMLGHNFLQFRKPEKKAYRDEFWEYHKAALSRAGESFSWSRVIRASVFSLYRAFIAKISYH